MQAQASAAPLAGPLPLKARSAPRGSGNFEDILKGEMEGQVSSAQTPWRGGRVRRGVASGAPQDCPLFEAPQVVAKNGEPLVMTKAGSGPEAVASLPPLLQELARFLSALPGQTLKIPADKVEALKAYLVKAGFPVEAVDRLLLNNETQEYELSLDKLASAWQQLARDAAGSLGQTPKTSTPPAGETVATASDPRQEPAYQRRWQAPILSEEQVPKVRLALMRLGATSEQLAALDQEAAAGTLSLEKLRNILTSPTNLLPSEEMAVNQKPAREEFHLWRQLLQAAGLTPEEVDKLVGENQPATQKELKATLLSLAPQPASEAEAQAQEGGKPVYLPQNLQVGALGLGQAKEDKSHLFGEGGRRSYAEVQGQQGQPASASGPAAQEAWGLVTPDATVPSVAQAAANRSGAPLSPPWQPLTPALREAVWSQVQSGIITNLGPGESKITLQLNPPELGQIELTLHLNGQDLAVTALASRPEVAELAAQGANQLLQTLAQQGVVLTQFQVQMQPGTGLKAPAALAGNRERGGGTADRHPAEGHKRHLEVSRFV